MQGDLSSLKYLAGVKALGVDSKMFYEQNLYNLTNTMGASFDKKLGKNLYNISFGVTNWENEGIAENVEKYLALGVEIDSKSKVMTSLIMNSITGAKIYNTSYSFNLDKYGTNQLALEASVFDQPNDFTEELSGELFLKGKFGF